MGSDLYSPAELWVDGVIHALGVSFAIGAALWLWEHGAGLEGKLSLAAYALGLVAMLGASAAYNLWSGPGKDVLRRIDHSMIFVMIAATYAPFVEMRLPRGIADWLGATVWCGALLGVVLKVWCPRRFEKVSLALYLGLGWSVALALDSLSANVARSTIDLLLAGGILYTIGLPICLLDRLPFHNALWHAFVLAATICHFVAISAEFA